jgi:uncharacterized flavoprotein (TIGR03862 family)
VFPKTMKASPLLRAWLARLAATGGGFRLRHLWTGWDESGRLRFTTPDGSRAIQADASVLALGGASWPRLGSDGAWTAFVAQAGIAIAPLQPANCGVLAAWSDVFRQRFAGQPLKRIEVCVGERKARGEAIVTSAGLEGGAIYALSGVLREALSAHDGTILTIDLRPDMTVTDLQQRLAAPRLKQSLATFLRKAASLSPVEIGLLHEATMAMPGRLAALSPDDLAALIKAVPVKITGLAPIARAISTAGGIAFDAIDENFMLRRKPGVFVAGEMLDWEAPTGGYLLQASFATGAAAARGALAWLARDPREAA